jgi:hypothetical protein
MSLVTLGLIVMVIAIAFSLLAPAPTRPIPGMVCVVQLAGGGIALTVAFALLAMDRWWLAGAALTIAIVVGLPAFWVAQAPDSEPPDEDGQDDGGGGGGRPPRPRHPEPSGPGLDWADFDRLRERWAQEPEPGREPVGV